MWSDIRIRQSAADDRVQEVALGLIDAAHDNRDVIQRRRNR
jgi:hypothetical protein